MKYQVRKYRGKIVPNERQWQFLLRELEERMESLQHHKDGSGLEGRYADPLTYLAASTEFAEDWLLKKQAREFLALLWTLAEKIQDGRESAAKLVALWGDEEIRELPWGIRGDRSSLIATTAGIGYHFHTPWGHEENDIIVAIQEHRDKWTIKPREPLDNFGDQDIWQFLGYLPKLKKDHPKAVQRKIAWDPLKQLQTAASELQVYAGQIDRLFAQMWHRYTEIPGQEAALELAMEALAGPLVNYTYTGAGWRRNYRDPAAAIAWSCQQSLDWTRDNIEGLKLRIEKDSEEIVAPLVENFDNWWTIFVIALETAEAAEKKAQGRKKKKVKDQKDLAEEPIRVPAFIYEDEATEASEQVTRILVDPKALLKGLERRQGFVNVMGIVVGIKTLRGWLKLANQKPIEDMAVNWTKWRGNAIPTGRTQAKIAQVDWLYATAQRTVEKLDGYPGLVLVPGSQGGSLQIVGSLAHFEATAGQFVHRVQPVALEKGGTTANEEMKQRHSKIFERAGKILVEALEE